MQATGTWRDVLLCMTVGPEAIAVHPATRMRMQDASGSGPRSVCVIDGPSSSAASAAHSNRSDARGLLWLGGKQHVLAIVRTSLLHLVSLTPSVAPGCTGSAALHSGFSWLQPVAASARIVSVAAELEAGVLLLATADARVTCYSMLGAVPGSHGGGGNRASETRSSEHATQHVWQHSVPAPHLLLTVCPTTTALAASADPAVATIAIWRSAQLGCADTPAASAANGNSRSDAGPSLDWLRLSSPASALAFRPHASRNAQGSLAPASTLMAACADGCIRLWIDTDLADTLPAALADIGNLVDAKHGGKATLGRTMCLAHVLSMPGARPDRPVALAVTWSQPPEGADDILASCSRRVAWLVATRMHADPHRGRSTTGAAALDELNFADDYARGSAGGADELCAWAVTVDAVEKDLWPSTVDAATAAQNGAASHKQAGAKSELGLTAKCRGPRMNAVLWGRDDYQARAWFHCAGLS